MLLSHFISRGADNSTFFSGNRRIPWPIVAVAMICAPITGVTFISVPGMVLTQGYAYLQMALGFIVGYFIIALWLIPLFYRRNLISIYGFLEERFGGNTYKTGAWFFLVSKILGTSVRFFVVCLALHQMVFSPLGFPFALTVGLTMSLMWFLTVKGGVKSVVWTDMMKSLCLISSIILCIYFISSGLGVKISEIPRLVGAHSTARVFFFDNPSESTYFWKQFVAGVFLVIAMTGLDQDMMQHPLSCKDARSAGKNMVLSSVLQFAVISLFLMMGTLQVIYLETHSVAYPERSDNLFATVAFHEGLPFIVGVLFIIGLVSASYSSVGSALTSLTTSFSVDILSAHKHSTEASLSRKRKLTHTAMAATIAAVILIIYHLSSENAINAVFTLASFTYGPILGLFVFGLFNSRRTSSKWIPAVCVAAPCLAWLVQWMAETLLQYRIGYELLLINAAFTYVGLWALSFTGRKSAVRSEYA
ncbi:MAG: sodium:solute symporter [Duncaniella sp.]|nr:sodium:solute symporter [Duncaniella sp.]